MGCSELFLEATQTAGEALVGGAVQSRRRRDDEASQ